VYKDFPIAASVFAGIGFFMVMYFAGTTHLSCTMLVKEKNKNENTPTTVKILIVFMFLIFRF
jgi:hypothetical protein